MYAGQAFPCYIFASAWYQWKHTYVPESNEYVNGIASERELEESSMGILSVPLKVAVQPELPG